MLALPFRERNNPLPGCQLDVSKSRQGVRQLIDETGARGNLVADAHLAALAIEHGATLCTDDVDFRRFKGLKLELPLRNR